MSKACNVYAAELKKVNDLFAAVVSRSGDDEGRVARTRLVAYITGNGYPSDIAKAVVDGLHSFEDVSIHGCPLWECRWCGCTKRRDDQLCPSALEGAVKAVRELLERERLEHCRLVLKLAREKFLLDKYKGDPRVNYEGGYRL